MPRSKITFLFFSHICLLKWMIKAKGRYILSKKNVMYCVCVVQFTRAWITTKKTNKKASRRIQYKNRGNYVVSNTHLFLLQTFTSPTSHFFLFTMRLLSNTQNCAIYILASFFSAFPPWKIVVSIFAPFVYISRYVSLLVEPSSFNIYLSCFFMGLPFNAERENHLFWIKEI